MAAGKACWVDTAALCAGAATALARRALLEAHRERVRAHVAELTACLLVLDTKIAGYAATEPRGETDE